MKTVFKVLGSLLVIVYLSGCQEKKQKTRKIITKEMLLEMNRKMVSTEEEIINRYIADHQLELEKSSTGLRFNITKGRKNHPMIIDEDLVILKYSTQLLDGTICYTSDKDGLKRFSVGKGTVESGLEEAVKLMTKGDKAQLILPPYLAHGVAGDGQRIPKLAILVMDIEILDVQRPEKAE